MSLGVPSVTLFDYHSVGMDTSETQYGIASTYSEEMEMFINCFQYSHYF